MNQPRITFVGVSEESVDFNRHHLMLIKGYIYQPISCSVTCITMIACLTGDCYCEPVLNILQSSRNFVCRVSIWHITKRLVGGRQINKLKLLHYVWDHPSLHLIQLIGLMQYVITAFNFSLHSEFRNAMPPHDRISMYIVQCTCICMWCTCTLWLMSEGFTHGPYTVIPWGCSNLCFSYYKLHAVALGLLYPQDLFLFSYSCVMDFIVVYVYFISLLSMNNDLGLASNRPVHEMKTYLYLTDQVLIHIWSLICFVIDFFYFCWQSLWIWLICSTLLMPENTSIQKSERKRPTCFRLHWIHLIVCFKF